MRNRASTVVVIALLAACKGPKQQVGSSDVRLDGAGPSDTVDSTQTRMCSTDQGDVFVAWSDARKGTPGIWVTGSSDSGAHWTSPVQIDQGNADSTSPTIACDHIGDVVTVDVAWEYDGDGELQNHNIYVSTSGDAGKTWSKPQNLDNDPDGKTMSLGPRILSEKGDVYVAWFDSANGAYDIFVAASRAGGQAFGDPIRVDSDAAGAAYSAWPRIVADANQHVYVVWEDSRDGKSDVYFASSKDRAKTFSADIRLDTGDKKGANDSFEPEIAADDNNTVYVVWHDERDGDGRSVYMNWSADNGTGWADSAIRVDSDAAGLSDSIFPVVAMHAGTAHIAWQDKRGAAYDIYDREAKGGAFVAAEQRLDDGDGAGFSNSLQPQIVATDGGVVVAWQDLRDDSQGLGYDDLYYNWSADEGTTWEASDLRIDSIANGTKYAHDLNLGVSKDQLLASWTDGRNGTADVYFHDLKLGDEASYVPLSTK